jgi:hypothetical protein
MNVVMYWASKIIYVPKSELTLIQAAPREIREMNLNEFRLALKEEEWSEAGMPFLDTHRHNTEVTLGGLTFARVIEIINGYTVTFEDGQYAVELVGANSNIQDVSNVNQVSIRPNNSAGLISTPLIEYASFEGGVSVDETSSYTGTVNLVGTPLKPVNNWADAKLIDDYRGFKRYYVIGSATLTGSYDFSNCIFEGRAHTNDSLVVIGAVDVMNATFRGLTVEGTLDGGNELSDCIVTNLVYVNGHIHRSGLIGSIELAGGSSAVIADCNTINPYDPPIIDMGGSGQNLAMPNYSGIVIVKNLTGSNFCGIGVNAGEVILDSTTVTSGTIHVSGVGRLVDQLGNPISTGTWNGGVTIISTLISGDTLNSEDIADAVWDEALAGHTTAGSAADAVHIIRKIQSNKLQIIEEGGQTKLVVFEDNGSTRFKTFILTDPSGDTVDLDAKTPTTRTPQ